jgi:hypothetical protein
MFFAIQIFNKVLHQRGLKFSYIKKTGLQTEPNSAAGKISRPNFHPINPNRDEKCNNFLFSYE